MLSQQRRGRSGSPGRIRQLDRCARYLMPSSCRMLHQWKHLPDFALRMLSHFRKVSHDRTWYAGSMQPSDPLVCRPEPKYAVQQGLQHIAMLNPQSIGRIVGVLFEIVTFDGSGGIKTSLVGPAGAATFTGTYTTNSDGSGTITLIPDANPSAAPVTFAYVAADASVIYLLRTSGGGSGGDVISGVGHLQ